MNPIGHGPALRGERITGLDTGRDQVGQLQIGGGIYRLRDLIAPDQADDVGGIGRRGRGRACVIDCDCGHAKDPLRQVIFAICK